MVPRLNTSSVQTSSYLVYRCIKCNPYLIPLKLKTKLVNGILVNAKFLRDSEFIFKYITTNDTPLF